MKPRIEQKLLIERSDYANFLAWLRSEGAEMLHPDRVITSTYFDSSDFAMWRDTDEGLVPRKKIRIRCYGGHTATCGAEHHLEVKKTTEYQRLKEIRPIPEWRRLVSEGFFDPDYGACFPMVRVEYWRSYFRVHGVRVTIDRNLHYQSMLNPLIHQAAIHDHCLAFEVKAPWGEDADRLWNCFPFPRTHFSKYERAVHLVHLRHS